MKIIFMNNIDEYNKIMLNTLKFNKIKYLCFKELNRKDNITKLPQSLKYIEFKGWCIDELPEFPDSLRYIIFGFCCGGDNMPPKPPKLPDTLKYIVYGTVFDVKLLKFPKSLKYIRFQAYYNQILPELPNSLKYIRFGEHYNQILPKLPDSLKYIEFGYNYTQILPEFPLSLKTLFLFTMNKPILKNNMFNKLIIYSEQINIYKYDNLIFNINKNWERERKGKFYTKFDTGFYTITKNLKAYLLYILYCKTFIPYEIYNYIYYNFNFDFNNVY